MTNPQTQSSNGKKTDSQAMTPPPAEGQAIEVFSYEGDEGGGFENQTMADRKLPMLVILQANSPEVLNSKGKLHAGMIYNTVTEEAVEEAYFVPAITDRCFLQFVPRDDGGGFRGRHAADAKVVAEALAKAGRSVGKIPLPQPPDDKGKPQPTHELVETFEVYCIGYDPKSGDVKGFAVIPFQSTKIKVYRAFNSQLGNFMPKIGPKQFKPGEIPMFAHRVKMTSETETNSKGTYFIPKLEPAQGGDDLLKSLITQKDPRYQAAKKLREDVSKGLAKAAYETMKDDGGPDPEAPAPF